MIVADDFIDALVKGMYIKPSFWKRTMLETTSYYADFDCENCNGRHSFLIRVVNGIHYVDETAVRNFARFHNIK